MWNVRAATSDHLDALAEVLADGFVDDPVMSWVFPDAASRPRLLQAMFGFLAEHRYLPYGQCTIAPDAAALWRPIGVESSDEFWEEHGSDFVAAVEGQIERLDALSEAMGEHHPHEPHRYLLAIAVRPATQGRGLGGILLAHTLAEADERGEPAYLEATSPRNRVLYERHGFETIAEFAVDDSPTLWPMWRAPR